MTAQVPGFAPLDWLVVALYALVLVGAGWMFSRGRTEDARDYFLAGNRIPAWLAAISVLSATQSAATFLGVPDSAYRGDLTYLAGVFSAILAALFVAAVLIPRFYALRVTTVYELLTVRFDGRATRWTGGMFLIGRVLAGGARVYLAAIALGMVIAGDAGFGAILLASAAIMLAAFGFTFLGGLKAVIWNDVVQFAIYLGSALAVLIHLRWQIPLSTAEIVDALRHAPVGVDKLRLFDWSTDLSKPFSVLAIVTGLFLLNVGNMGLDQDTTQRLLASPDARTGARGLIGSALITLPIVAMFLCIGLLLHIVYQRPDLMGGAARQASTTMGGERVTVFVHYILTAIPPGLRGLVTIGVTAAAVATTNSALNAMSSVLVGDFYRPWRERRGGRGEHHYVIAGRWGMALVGLAMFAVAALSYAWQRSADLPLLDFALGVMVFAYAGLLGVYGVGLFTSRGTGASVAWALLAGFVTVALLQPAIGGALGLGPLARLAFPFQLVLGTLVAAAVCAWPKGNLQPPEASAR